MILRLRPHSRLAFTCHFRFSSLSKKKNDISTTSLHQSSSTSTLLEEQITTAAPTPSNLVSSSSYPSFHWNSPISASQFMKKYGGDRFQPHEKAEQELVHIAGRIAARRDSSNHLMFLTFFPDADNVALQTVVSKKRMQMNDRDWEIVKKSARIGSHHCLYAFLNLLFFFAVILLSLLSLFFSPSFKYINPNLVCSISFIYGLFLFY